MDNDYVNTKGLSADVWKYLLNSYLYYIKYEDTFMTDEAYDILCNRLYKDFDNLPDNEQDMLSRDSLSAGTGYDIPLSVYRLAGITE
jgi:hypothetical protein